MGKNFEGHGSGNSSGLWNHCSCRQWNAVHELNRVHLNGLQTHYHCRFCQHPIRKRPFCRHVVQSGCAHVRWLARFFRNFYRFFPRQGCSVSLAFCSTTFYD
uniref:(northern house mosquito) hypothetical protein n=1 Tax=Culex pipiens TaxID=7175 RepID=A0A8D8CGE1_CULPI